MLRAGRSVLVQERVFWTNIGATQELNHQVTSLHSLTANMTDELQTIEDELVDVQGRLMKEASAARRSIAVLPLPPPPPAASCCQLPAASGRSRWCDGGLDSTRTPHGDTARMVAMVARCGALRCLPGGEGARRAAQDAGGRSAH